MKTHDKYTDPHEIIAARRQELEMTQAELAKKLNYSNVNFISMLEQRRSKVPLEKTIEIAEALKMSKKWFIEQVMRDRFEKIADEIYGPRRKQQ